MSDSTALSRAIAAQMPRVRSDLAELVAIPSVADADQFPPEECERAAQWVVKAFSEAGIEDVEAALTPDDSKVVHGHAAGPDGSPTVLLYSHYDVQPPLGAERWDSPPWELTERAGRWYGRGTADCKGNVVMHLAVLRALREIDGGLPCSVKIVCEGSEEQGTGGLEQFVAPNADRFEADAILVADLGNAAVGVPTLTASLRGMIAVDVRVRGLAGQVHSGMFGGPAPDALAGLVRMLASLHDDAGNTTVDGLDNTAEWDGAAYASDQFRSDAGVLDGVGLMGDGTPADLIWSRYAATVTGLDAAPVAGAVNAVPATAAARVSLRVPPGASDADARDALIAHLRARVPWSLDVEIETVAMGRSFQGSLGGPAYDAMTASLAASYGRDPIVLGEGGSIPLCSVLADTYPDAEIMLFGVEEPQCLVHAPNESVDPSEIEHIALAEALFLQAYGAGRRG